MIDGATTLFHHIKFKATQDYFVKFKDFNEMKFKFFQEFQGPVWILKSTQSYLLKPSYKCKQNTQLLVY